MSQFLNSVDKNDFRGLVRRLDTQGRIVIPKEYCYALGLDTSNRVEFILFEDGILLKPWSVEHAGPIRQVDFMGRLLIPVDIRTIFGFHAHDELEMRLLTQGIFIQKANACSLRPMAKLPPRIL